MKRFGTIGVLAAILASGCSGESAGWEGMRIGRNLHHKDSHLKVFLDNQQAKQNTAKKAMTGYSNWKISEPVGTSPTLKFQIEDPDKFGRITMVDASIFQQFQADYSTQAEYTIYSKSQEPMNQMKPDTDYDLGHLPAGMGIRDLTGKEVSKVDLKAGMKYKLTLTVKADKSETAIIEFKTK